MSDFHQSGPVAALPRLLARPIEDMEAQIGALRHRFPVSLVIPMVPAEMDRPALARIRDELCQVEYLDAIVVSLNNATRDDYARAVRYFEPYPHRLVILWSEAPAVQAFLADLERVGLSVGTPGKGRACWLAMGYLLAEEKADYLVFQDADVVNFSREMLTRLILPALDPIVDFDFVKAYLRSRVRSAARPRHAPLRHAAAGRVREAHRARSVHPLPLVVPLRAVGGVRRAAGPGVPHAPARRTGGWRSSRSSRSCGTARRRASARSRSPTATSTSTRTCRPATRRAG